MKNLKSIMVYLKSPSLFGVRAVFYLLLIGAAWMALSVVGTAVAQSQTRGSDGARQSQTRGGVPMSQSQGKPALALGGVCPVCLVEMGKVIQGNSQYQSTRDRRTYFFPGPEQKEMFERNPEKYIPAFHGYCSVCQVEMGELVPGSPEHFTVHEGKLFLFATADQKKMFDHNPAKYAGVTLGLDGLCPVCLADGKMVPGKPEITATYDGVEYRFPTQEFRDTFLQNQEKYIPAADGQCLVCKVDMNKNVLGSAKHSLVVDGKSYLFVDDSQAKKFQENPSKYLPALVPGMVPKGGEISPPGSSKRDAKPNQSNSFTKPIYPSVPPLRSANPNRGPGGSGSR